MALTVDIEARHHGLGVPEGTDRVVQDTAWLLEQFALAGVTGTFFVLGEVAARHPALVQRIAAEGHEVGFHGATHRFLRDVGPRAFARELQVWRPRLEDLAGAPVRGYRAPCFSLTRETRWALPALAEAGFGFDASIYPGPNDRYGWVGAPRRPARVPATGLAVFPVPLLRWPPVAFSGGAYLRLLPERVVRGGLRGSPGMVYVHPWEVASRQPWDRRARLRLNLTRHAGRGGMRRKVAGLLESLAGRLGPMSEVLSGLEPLPPWSPG